MHPIKVPATESEVVVGIKDNILYSNMTSWVKHPSYGLKFGLFDGLKLVQRYFFLFNPLFKCVPGEN